VSRSAAQSALGGESRQSRVSDTMGCMRFVKRQEFQFWITQTRAMALWKEREGGVRMNPKDF